jgi:hypothetical protein
MAPYVSLGGLAEWSNAIGCKPTDGASPTVQGFESLTRRQNNNDYTPAEALTSTGARNAQPKPYESSTLSIRLLTVELNRRFHSDLPQLPDRSRESWEGPQWPSALQVPAVRQAVSEQQEKPFGADVRLPKDTVVRILHCLVEGNSVRSTARLCDVQPRTVLAILVLAGENCEKIMGRVVVNVPVKDVQCDEIWGFVQKKEANKTPAEAHDDSKGDAYCFVAIEANTKLVLNFALGRRTAATTDAFIEGPRAATAPQRFQISTDGFPAYKASISTTLGDRVDYGMLIKPTRSRLTKCAATRQPT